MKKLGLLLTVLVLVSCVSQPMPTPTPTATPIPPAPTPDPYCTFAVVHFIDAIDWYQATTDWRFQEEGRKNPGRALESLQYWLQNLEDGGYPDARPPADCPQCQRVYGMTRGVFQLGIECYTRTLAQEWEALDYCHWFGEEHLRAIDDLCMLIEEVEQRCEVPLDWSHNFCE